MVFVLALCMLTRLLLQGPNIGLNMPDPPNEGTDQPRPLGADGKPVPGPQQVQQTLAQKRMAQQQAQVDQVVDIMRSNVEKVIERDVKLHKLDERAQQLESGASQFEMHMGKLKKNLWRANMKWVVLLGLIALALVIAGYLHQGSDTDLAPERRSAPEEVLETAETTLQHLKNPPRQTETVAGPTLPLYGAGSAVPTMPQRRDEVRL